MAAGDQVKLSSESLQPMGEIPRAVSAYDAPEVRATGVSAASDVWALGMTLIEVLTQRAPDAERLKTSGPQIEQAIPEPFRGIAQRCLQLDPPRRCGMREIRDRLEGNWASPTTAPTEPVASRQPTAANWKRWIIPAMIVPVVIVLLLWSHFSHAPTAVETATAPPPTGQTGSAQPSQPSEAHPSSTQLPSAQTSSPQPAPLREGANATVSPSSPEEPRSTEKTVANDEIVERVMPQVSRSAQRTINGKIKVHVKVKVDATGKVTQATLKDAGPSKYFARVALEAAERWKFAPTQPQEHDQDTNKVREWILSFVFTRSRSEATVARAR
jgi:TonB family protein